MPVGGSLDLVQLERAIGGAPEEASPAQENPYSGTSAGTGEGDGGGDSDAALATVTELDAVAVRPSVLIATASSRCDPGASVDASRRPFGSPLNWYGAARSLQIAVPSILKSTSLTVAPIGSRSR